ncbi:GNAT family N-acetyltransferase [Kineosporia sp. NBRC 101731]|uniref:GNAT family N-acetyltransferase n=1 Tax=Kineosporia sp. NBRC 101731 TaxID=3032199 RepID=UPI0024A124EC|nr:GNAT family N-acetyltransferase [Kineosporia sp. NBRC 101731]GLY26883.1 GNAT family N-acetyltransferase [Kineosporia sp. NBRC 101731]
MSRRLAPLTLDNLSDLPSTCRRCVTWELDPLAAKQAMKAGDTGFEKEAWISGTLLEWGSCGRIAYVDEQPAGFVTYAPPTLVPRALEFPTSPVSGDAVLLMTARVLPQFAGAGLARMLLQATAKDLSKRGVRALEAFGLTAGGAMTAAPDDEDKEKASCLVPADLLTAVGFKTVRQHHRFPRLRLELKTATSWREDVELALEQILGTVRLPALTGTGVAP